APVAAGPRRIAVSPAERMPGAGVGRARLRVVVVAQEVAAPRLAIPEVGEEVGASVTAPPGAVGSAVPTPRWVQVAEAALLALPAAEVAVAAWPAPAVAVAVRAPVAGAVCVLRTRLATWPARLASVTAALCPIPRAR